MRRLVIGTLLFSAVLWAAPSEAQEATHDSGKIWRMVYYKIKPGKTDAFWKDMHENAKPILDIAIREGAILEYRILQNNYIDDADDWDVMMMVAHENYAQLDELEAKAGRAYLEHFGSAEAAAESTANRDTYREVVKARLVKEVTLE